MKGQVRLRLSKIIKAGSEGVAWQHWVRKAVRSVVVLRLGFSFSFNASLESLWKEVPNGICVPAVQGCVLSSRCWSLSMAGRLFAASIKEGKLEFWN